MSYASREIHTRHVAAYYAYVALSLPRRLTVRLAVHCRPIVTVVFLDMRETRLYTRFPSHELRCVVMISRCNSPHQSMKLTATSNEVAVAWPCHKTHVTSRRRSNDIRLSKCPPSPLAHPAEAVQRCNIRGTIERPNRRGRHFEILGGPHLRHFRHKTIM